LSTPEYAIMKKFPGIGDRFLDSPERPYRWVKDVKDAYRFASGSDLADEIEGSEIIEVEGW